MSTLHQITNYFGEPYYIQLTSDNSLKALNSKGRDVALIGMCQYDPTLPDLKERLIEVLKHSKITVLTSEIKITPQLALSIPRQANKENINLTQTLQAELARIFLNDPTLSRFKLDLERSPDFRTQVFSVWLDALGYAMRSNQHVKDLEFEYQDRSRGFNTEEIKLIEKALKKMPSVKKLRLYPAADPGSLQALSSFIELNISIKTLNLSGYRLGDDLADALAEALRKNPYLQHLGIRYNAFSSKGVKPLAQALKVNDRLKIFEIMLNDIGDEGAEAFGECLLVNRGLETLNLSETKVGSVGAKALANGLKLNTTLRILSLDKNQIDDIGAVDLGMMLAQNTTLEILDISINKISNHGLQHIATSLANNKKNNLSKLWVRRCKINPTEICSIPGLFRNFGYAHRLKELVFAYDPRDLDEFKFVHAEITQERKNLETIWKEFRQKAWSFFLGIRRLPLLPHEVTYLILKAFIEETDITNEMLHDVVYIGKEKSIHPISFNPSC